MCEETPTGRPCQCTGRPFREENPSAVPELGPASNEGAPNFHDEINVLKSMLDGTSKYFDPHQEEAIELA